MLDILRNPNAHEMEEKTRCANGQQPCVICGRPCDMKTSPLVHLHEGGYTAVTEEEAATLDPAADMGCYPVGKNCIKKHPELKPYLLNIPIR